MTTQTLEERLKGAKARLRNSSPGSTSHTEANRDIGRIQYELDYRRNNPRAWLEQQEDALRG